MLAIHDGARPPAPKRPERVVPQRVAFTGTAEQPRTDYFIAGTGQTRIATAPATARRPHITNPVSGRSEEHTSELQSLMRISYAVFCLKKTQIKNTTLRITIS